MNKPIRKDELERMYNEMTVSEVVEKLDMSLAGFYKMLDSVGIPRKNPGIANRRKRQIYDVVE